MSSKKSNLNSKDHQYMNLAINLAKDHIGLTGLNPSVGCLIVKNDEIISTGQTEDHMPNIMRSKIIKEKIMDLHYM